MSKTKEYPVVVSCLKLMAPLVGMSTRPLITLHVSGFMDSTLRAWIHAYRHVATLSCTVIT